MKISFDYFDRERERGEEWAENLPEILRAVAEYYNIDFAITSRGVWARVNSEGDAWEYRGTRTMAREWLQELKRNIPWWDRCEVDAELLARYN